MRTGVVIGRDFRLPRGVRFLSRLFLTHELGYLAPVPVELAPLPPHLPAVYSEARELFGLLWGLRMALEPILVATEGIAFSKTIVAALLRCEQHEAYRLITYLWRDGRVLEMVGRDGPRGPYLYKPAESDDHHGAGAQPRECQAARSRSNDRITGRPPDQPSRNS